MAPRITNDGAPRASQYDNDNNQVYGPPAPPEKAKSEAAGNERPASSLDAPWEDPNWPDGQYMSYLDYLAQPEPANTTNATNASSSTWTKPSSNAQRTQERSADDGPYADAGITPDGHGVFAGAAVVKGKVPRGGGDIEVLSASIQVGLQNEAQVGVLRANNLELAKGKTLSIEVGTVELHEGIHNPDGSTGFNIGVDATVVGVGVTTTDGANSATVGGGLGIGWGGHIGVQDADHNGKLEVCGGLSIGAGVKEGKLGPSGGVGGCVELPIETPSWLKG
ncbi:MAG: hypothetical protein FWD73_16290 [Polyangiaceae bacterium]|nr:hypothetical protein [Polyangiaceae bacterium]